MVDPGSPLEKNDGSRIFRPQFKTVDRREGDGGNVQFIVLKWGEDGVGNAGKE